MSRDMSTQGAAILAAGSGAEFKQTVVITGASRGIGLEFARQLLQAGGYRVVATCRQPEEAHELQRLASEMPGRIIGPLRLDVTDGASVLRAVEDVTAQATAVHLLINNAGIPNHKDPQDHVLNTAPEMFNAVYDVNCTGILRTTQAFLPLLRAARGVVVNVSSPVGSLAKADALSPGFFAAYRCAKAAANMLTRTLAAGEQQVSFLALQPGPVATELGRVMRSKVPGLPDEVVEGVPAAEAVKSMLEQILKRSQEPAASRGSGASLFMDGTKYPW